MQSHQAATSCSQLLMVLCFCDLSVIKLCDLTVIKHSELQVQAIALLSCKCKTQESLS